MSLPEEDVFAGQDEASDALFQGDTGALPLETRRVLVQLLLGPSLDARRHAKLWPVLLRDEVIVRSRLAELFLEVVVERDLQVAFTRQADVGDLDSPTLLRRSPLTFIDSALLLYLRQQLAQADAHGERAVVASDEIEQHLGMYERASNTDRAGFIRKVGASIEKMKKNSILQKIRGSEDRYEIAPTLKLLFSPEEVQALTQTYRLLADGDAAPVKLADVLEADDEEAQP